MNDSSFLRELAAKGEIFFTSEEFQRAENLSSVPAQQRLLRLKKKGAIATPYKGFHLIVPPQYQKIGCLPPQSFIPDLMKFLNVNYYCGLLSAAELYGAAHQKPQVFQVVLPLSRRSIQCGKVRVEFIVRKDMAKMPVKAIKTESGYLATSTPEVTALDVVNHPLLCGGLNNVVTVLEELAEPMEVSALENLMPLISHTPQLQRLGFLLEQVGQNDLALVVASELLTRRTDAVHLVSKIDAPVISYNKAWKIKINETWESDL